MRELIFGVLLLIAAAAIVTGVAILSVSAAFIAAGVLLGGWSWLVLSTGDEVPA